MSSKFVIENLESLQNRILQFLARYPNESFKSKELSRRIGIRSTGDEQIFKKALRSLQDEKKIMRIRGKRYSHLHIPEFLTGELQLTPRGFGIVVAENSGEEFFIQPENLGGAFQGDIVEVSLFTQSTKQRDRGARREGEIIRIVNQNMRTFVGTLEKIRKQFFVVPDDRRIAREILIAKENLNGANEGEKIAVEITEWKNRRQNPEGRVLEVLGKSGDLSAEIRSIVREYNLPASFTPEVVNELAEIQPEIPQSEVARRMDLRSLLCFTIDPEDAKDFDDAVSLERLADGLYRLGVHIADVSYYVRADSELDKEALRRGTSVYFPSGVIPMLPEKLSNNLCSLRPDEDKLTFSVMIDISPQGSIKDYKIVESIIRSKQRFSYEKVQEIIENLDHDRNIAPDDLPFADVLRNMHTLSKVLTKKRLKEGSIDFDSAESKFELDEKGKPVRITKKLRLDSNRLIEEFMLLANRIVARHIGFVKKDEKVKPFIYRVHDSPDPERIGELAVFVEKFGFKLNIEGGVTSKSLQRLLNQIKGTEVENVINEVVLRSMAKAIYSERNIGHYGLAFEYYSHFTSPIRRYPDLVVHRMLKKYNDGISASDLDNLRKRLPAIAKQSSEMERIAMEAERAAVKVMQVEYMKRHLGDEFHAVISGVTHFGIFVELTESLVEGMIHVRNLIDDYYVYDEKQYSLKGKHKHKQYRLGDPLEVKVVRVDPVEHQIDFSIIEEENAKLLHKRKH